MTRTDLLLSTGALFGPWHLLAELGCGKNGRELGAQTLADFFYRLPEYRARLAGRARTDDRALLERLDELLADDAAEARRFHALRARS